MTRMLVTGANGQLGLALQDAAKDSNLDLVFMDKGTLDITDAKTIKKCLLHNPLLFVSTLLPIQMWMVRNPIKHSPMRLMPQRLKPLPKSANNIGAGLYTFQLTMYLTASWIDPTCHPIRPTAECVWCK